MAGRSGLSARGARLRVLEEGVLAPSSTMSGDVALLEAFLRGDIPPTLRLYQWRVPAITYGLNQRLPERLVRTAEQLGIPLLRRPTGGKAVLHGHDLTLALVWDSGAHFPRQAYEQVLPLFIEAFRCVGVPATTGHAPAPHPLGEEDGGDCFATPALTDLVHAETGVKLLGCALRVVSGGTLLQASIPLHKPSVPTEPLFGWTHPEPPPLNLASLRTALVDCFVSHLLR